MSTSASLRDLAISDSGFVFDPHSGATFTLNASGLAILLALRDGVAVSAIGSRLRDAFDGVSATVDEDVADFLGALRAHGLIAQDAFLPKPAAPAARPQSNGAALAMEAAR